MSDDTDWSKPWQAKSAAAAKAATFINSIEILGIFTLWRRKAVAF